MQRSKARRPSSVSHRSLSRQLGSRWRRFILFCSVLTSTHRGRRDFLLVHVTRRLDSGPSTSLRSSYPPSLARKRSRTPASSSTRHHQPINKTDDVYCTSRSATSRLTTCTARLVYHSTRPTARTARPVRHLSRPTTCTARPARLHQSTNKADHVHCTSSSAS